MAEMVEIHFCGLWPYREAGVDCVLRAFHKAHAPGMADISYSFDASSGSFKVTCPSGSVQAAQELFNLVHSQLEDGAVLEDIRVFNSGPEDEDTAHNSWLWSPRAEKAVIASTRQRNGRDFPAAFDRYRYTTKWPCVHDEDELLGKTGPWPDKDELRSIERSSGALIHPASWGRLLYIGGTSQEAVTKAVGSLETHFNDPYDKAPSGMHLLYSEVETDYQVDARLLWDINNRLVTSTLLDPTLYSPLDLKEQYTALQSGVGLRICYHDSGKQAYISLFGPDAGPVFSGNGSRFSNLFIPGPYQAALQISDENWMACSIKTPSSSHEVSPGGQTSRLADDKSGQLGDLMSQAHGARPVSLSVASQQAGVTRSPSRQGSSGQGCDGRTTMVTTTLGSSSDDFTDKFLDDLRNAFAKVMAGMRAKSGKLRLQAQLGRFSLAHSMPGPLASNTATEFANGWQPDDIVEILDTRCSPTEVTFTKILSIFAEDVEYLVQFRDGTGNLEWHRPQPLQIRGAVYEFTCEWKTMNMEGSKVTGDETFVIEVEQTRVGHLGYTIRRQDDAARSIWVHCLCRNWDVRLLLTHTMTKRLEALYGAFSRALLKTLVMPSDPTEPFDLNFAYDNSIQWQQGMHPFRTTITAVRVRHTARFNSNTAKSYLDITHVRDMRLGPGERASDVYRMVASPLEDDPSRGIFGSWYEASVSSAMAEEALRENETLGVGREARWTVDSMGDAGVIEALCRPALSLVRRMDGVGVNVENHQHGGLATPSPSVSGTETGTRTTETRDQMPNYW